jgi:hypothetical protein
MRAGKSALAIAAGVCCLGGGMAAVAGVAAAAPTGGAIHLFVQPGQTQGNGRIVITGAVGDYGTTRARVVGDRRLSVATLHQGTITFDLTAISRLSDATNPRVDMATCSAELAVSAAVPVVGGTGLYRGIHGSVTITEAFGFVGPRYTHGAKKGQCNLSNSAQPLAEMPEVYGSGSVAF